MRRFLESVKVADYPGTLKNKELASAIVKSKELPTRFRVEGYPFPIVAGVLGTRELLAKSLGTTPDKLVSTMTQRLESIKKATLVAKAGFLDNKIELTKTSDLSKHLPVIEFYAGKKYTSSSLVMVKFPGEGRQNVSFHRMMYLGGNRFGIRIIPQRHLDQAYTDAMNKGEDLNVAVVFGVHPAVELSAAFSYPRLDELDFASSLMGGLDVFKLPNGISVPADAEFVMEARITRDMTDEGPFIDLTATLDEVRKQPVLEVDRLYFRKDPVFRTILPGGNEHRMLMGVPQEPRMFAAISNTIPTVKNVVLTTGGCSWLHAVVQIKKKTEGDGKNAILAALAAHPSLKHVIIVDDDIDPSDPEQVEWAVATRFQADKGLVVVSGAKGSSLDPSTNKTSITSKWGIDATKPVKDNGVYTKIVF